ncbi:MAG: hydrogenase expression/formation protein HypE [Gemmatimonadota bacterium]|nr:hydrogenase expression/formation protein HypE [Gemmatimonadota bacterium]
MSGERLAVGPACPIPVQDVERVQLGHGSGGKLSRQLLRDRFLPRFSNPALDLLGDGALLPATGSSRLAMSTDTFVVRPLEFPGGNIGTLAVHGTLNDVAMMGARPMALSAGFILEEGLPLDLLDRILDAMADAARQAGVDLVAGDTKVVERGKADGLYINTTGLGLITDSFTPSPQSARAGDVVLVSGPIGCHGVTILATRGDIAFEVETESDTACLHPLVERLRASCGEDVHVLRDPTRGGVASALNEIAEASGIGVELDGIERAVPAPVRGACEMLGLDPLYVANEGILVAFVAASAVDQALAALKGHPLGREARVIGRAVDQHPGMVVARTGLGGTRIVDLLPGAQLPRIC